MTYYTKEQLLKKYKGKYINTYPHFYEQRDENGKWITLYEVREVHKTIHENCNLPEEETL